MRILMLSWEYPPKNVGGLSTHVYNISHTLAEKGNEVHVITCEEGIAPVEENDNGVWVHRVTPYKIETEDFTKWIMQLNFAMIEEGIRVIKKVGKIDVIHAHDWLAAYSAKALKWAFNIPMVCTMHATEKGRNGGISTDMQRYISSTEWLLTYESWKVVVCSNYMRDQVRSTFSMPDDKIWVIPNGVDSNEFDFDFDWLSFRRNYAEDDEKIILFLGRHVFEKGVQLIIEAAPEIVKGYNRVKFVIAGQGPMTEELQYRVKELGLEDKFLFPGYINEDVRNKLYRVSNVAVFPSLYEPFGIVALEAMAAGCPVVAADTGGLKEIIKHKVNGMKMINGLPESLKDNILELFYDEGLENYIKENAKKEVREKYTWDKVADMTMKMYELIKEETKGTIWEIEEDKKEKFTKKLSSDNNLKKQTVENLKSNKELKTNKDSKSSVNVENEDKKEAKDKDVEDKKEEDKKAEETKKIEETKKEEVKQVKDNKVKKEETTVKETLKKVKVEKVDKDNDKEAEVESKKEEKSTKKTKAKKADEKEEKPKKTRTRRTKITKKDKDEKEEKAPAKKRRGRRKKKEEPKKEEVKEK